MTDISQTRVAEFYVKTRTRPAEVVICDISGGRRQPPIAIYCVTNKREARGIAASHGATPWNF